MFPAFLGGCQRQEPICPVHIIMTLKSSAEQARHHTVWHGHRTPIGTGPLRGGSKLAFFGSRLRTAFRDACRYFQCQALV